MNKNNDVSTATAYEATPATTISTKTQSELLLANQIWLNLKDNGTVKVLSMEIGLLCVVARETVFPQGHLMPAQGIRGVYTNVPLEIAVAILTNLPVHVPKHIVLCSAEDASSTSLMYMSQNRTIRSHKVCGMPLGVREPCTKFWISPLVFAIMTSVS